MEGMFPEVVFRVFGIPIRDTVISTWIMIAIIAGAAYAIAPRWPAVLEMLVDFVTDSVSSSMSGPVAPYMALLGTLTIFIAVASSLGVVPVLVSPTRDINTPLALALVVFLAIHYYGIRAKGLGGYLKHVATPIYALPMEIIGQFSRTLSLTLRLFGNVISTELIVVVVTSLVPLFVPLIIIAFAMFTGALQAYIFTILAAVYLGAAVESS